MDKQVSQRFGVEEIRRIREEDDMRYQGMTPEEISKDISERAKEARDRIDEIRREKTAQRAM
jgi:hypothetical protein